MTSQMFSSPQDNNSFTPSQGEISSSAHELLPAGLEHSKEEGSSKAEAAPDVEFEPELETESDTDVDPVPEVTRVTQEGMVHATANGKIETSAMANKTGLQNEDLSLPPPPPPPPPPQSMQEFIGQNEDSADDDNGRFVSKHNHGGNLGANAIYWEKMKKRHAAVGTKSSAAAVKVELEELRRKQLAKSGKNLLSEKALSEANNYRFSPQSRTYSSPSAGAVSEIEFYLSQRARSNELKKQQLETLEFYHSYRGKNVGKKKAQSSGNSPTRPEERRHSYSPSACPFGTSPRTSSKKFMASSLRTSLGSAGLPLATLNESMERPNVERRATSDSHAVAMNNLEEDFDRRLAKYSPRTRNSIREAISREMLNEDGLPELEINDPKKWDEKVNDCPVLPFEEDTVKELPENNDTRGAEDANVAEEKDDRESKRAALDESGKVIADERKETKSRKESPTKSRKESPTKSRKESPTKSRKESPTKSRKESPTKSRKESPTKSRKESPTKSRKESPIKGSSTLDNKKMSNEPHNAKNASKKSLSSTQQSAKKKKESKNTSNSASNRVISRTQKSPKKEKGSKEQRGEKSTTNRPVAEIIIPTPMPSPSRGLSSTRNVAKKENGGDENSQRKKEGKAESPRNTKSVAKESARNSTIPPKPPGKKKHFVPRVATLTKSQVPQTKTPRLPSPKRTGSPMKSRSKHHPTPVTPVNRRRCNSAPTADPSAFGSDSSVCVSIDNSRRKKSVPLYNGRSIGVDRSTKRNHVLCCERKWEVNLHGSRAGCDRCLHFASEEEKKSFATNGHHHRIMMTRGGCHRSCTYFPRKKDEIPARLCHKCFYDTHELKLW